MGFRNWLRRKKPEEEKPIEVGKKPEEPDLLEQLCDDPKLYEDISRVLPLDISREIKIGDKSATLTDIKEYGIELRDEKKDSLRARMYFRIGIGQALVQGDKRFLREFILLYRGVISPDDRLYDALMPVKNPDENKTEYTKRADKYLTKALNIARKYCEQKPKPTESKKE